MAICLVAQSVAIDAELGDKSGFGYPGNVDRNKALSDACVGESVVGVVDDQQAFFCEQLRLRQWD